MKAKRSTPRRSPERNDHGPGMARARELTFARSRNMCEVNGPGCTRWATDFHHRLTVRYGPDCPCNGLAACSHCHHENVHGQPEQARTLGQIVSRHATNPAGVPMQVDRLGIVMLTCDGTYLALDGRAVLPSHPA